MQGIEIWLGKNVGNLNGLGLPTKPFSPLRCSHGSFIRQPFNYGFSEILGLTEMVSLRKQLRYCTRKKKRVILELSPSKLRQLPLLDQYMKFKETASDNEDNDLVDMAIEYRQHQAIHPFLSIYPQESSQQQQIIIPSASTIIVYTQNLSLFSLRR